MLPEAQVPLHCMKVPLLTSTPDMTQKYGRRNQRSPDQCVADTGQHQRGQIAHACMLHMLLLRHLLIYLMAGMQ